MKIICIDAEVIINGIDVPVEIELEHDYEDGTSFNDCRVLYKSHKQFEKKAFSITQSAFNSGLYDDDIINLLEGEDNND